jgi:hypothetical protein
VTQHECRVSTSRFVAPHARRDAGGGWL